MARSDVVMLGLSTHMGWARAVAVVVGAAGPPSPLASVRLATGDPGDRTSVEPYHVAGGFDGLDRVPRPPDPEATVARGLAAQRRITAVELNTWIEQLRASAGAPAGAAILTGRGRLAASLDRILASHAQIHVAEGLAVRESVARALAAAGVSVHEVDQKSLFEQVGERLGLSRSEALAALAPKRPADGGAWHQEDKRCALAAWLAAVDGRLR